jgi:hypothetical protein
MPVLRLGEAAMSWLLIVGEERSPKAIRMGVRWEDEALAAKPLFEALRACGLDPLADCRFVNWFEGDGPAVVRGWTGPVVALGRKVEKALGREGRAFVFVTHPAARGAIRRRDRYVAHVGEQLAPLLRLRRAA